jgi:hypothetical protein
MDRSITPPIACNMNVFDHKQRERYNTIRIKILDATTGILEATDGYQLDFKYEPELFKLLSEFITLERLCCPFLNFEISINNLEDLNLKLTGPKGVKEFLQTEFNVDATCTC